MVINEKPRICEFSSTHVRTYHRFFKVHAVKSRLRQGCCPILGRHGCPIAIISICLIRFGASSNGCVVIDGVSAVVVTVAVGFDVRRFTGEQTAVESFACVAFFSLMTCSRKRARRGWPLFALIVELAMHEIEVRVGARLFVNELVKSCLMILATGEWRKFHGSLCGLEVGPAEEEVHRLVDCR